MAGPHRRIHIAAVPLWRYRTDEIQLVLVKGGSALAGAANAMQLTRAEAK